MITKDFNRHATHDDQRWQVTTIKVQSRSWRLK